MLELGEPRVSMLVVPGHLAQAEDCPSMADFAPRRR